MAKTNQQIEELRLIISERYSQLSKLQKDFDKYSGEFSALKIKIDNAITTYDNQGNITG